MTDDTSLEALLNQDDSHEAEETLDVTPEVEAVAPQPEPEEPKADPEVKAETPETKEDQPKAEDGDGKGGLPPWMHAKLKAKDDKLSALEAEMAQLRAAQQQVQQPQRQQVDPARQAMQFAEQQAFATRMAVSTRLARSEYSSEEVDAAMAWAKDRADADPNFNAQALQHQEPAFFAVEQYRQAQLQIELSQYGYDIDKLIAARQAKAAPAEQAALAPQVGTEPPKPHRRMPGDFSGAASAPSSVVDTGPTPLSELLNQG